MSQFSALQSKPWRLKLPSRHRPVRTACARMLSCISSVQLFVAPWTVACQAPLSMGFPRQQYRSGLPCPSPRDLPYPGIKPMSLASPALAGRFFTTSATFSRFLFLLPLNSYPLLLKYFQLHPLECVICF